MCTALAKVRMTTLLSSSESPYLNMTMTTLDYKEREMRVNTYKVEDFWAPPAGAFLGGEISELPSPVINLETQLINISWNLADKTGTDLRALLSTVSWSWLWLFSIWWVASWCRWVNRLRR